MKKIKLLVLMTALLYIPMGYQSYNIFNNSFDAKAQDFSWGFFKREKEEDNKIDSKIRGILQEMKEGGMTRSNIQDFNPEEFSTLLVKVNKQGEVQVYVYVNDVNEENISKLQENDLQVEIVNEKYKVVQGWLPFDRVEEVSKLDFVIKITPPSYGTPRTGSVETEGDGVLRSDEVRDMLGIDGSGVDVCVISDGVDSRASAQLSGDLPSNITIDPLLPGSGDEGTATLEIVHDIAPGANLFFSGPSTSLEMVESIKFCASSSHVTVDDLGFLGEPYFEDGPVAQEARNAVQQGVVFVSAAGNDALRHYQASYIDTDPSDNDNNFHDFGLAAGLASDTGWRFAVPPISTAAVFLQWNDPFGGSSNDYDLFLTNVTEGGILVSAGVGEQDGDDDPFEGVIALNLTLDFVQFALFINRFSGDPKTLEVFFNGPVTIVEDQFNVPSDSIFGHPSVPEVIAVGAVPFFDPFSVEPFSSEGPSTIFFPAFEQRPKPDLVAPDQVSVTGAGDFGIPTARSIFPGTSAAAPHVAGVAALILDANPNLTPSEVENALTSTAIDIGPSNVSGLA